MLVFFEKKCLFIASFFVCFGPNITQTLRVEKITLYLVQGEYILVNFQLLQAVENWISNT